MTKYNCKSSLLLGCIPCKPEQMYELMDMLFTKKEKQYFCDYFGTNKSMREIAVYYGVTASTVSRGIANAVRKLGQAHNISKIIIPARERKDYIYD